MKNNFENKQTSILAEQTAYAFAALPNIFVATLINAGILSIALWPAIRHEELFAWLAIISIVSLIRGLTFYKYNKSEITPDQVPVWHRRFILGSIVAALTWGSTAIFLFPPEDIARQVFLAFILGGMSAGAITSLSSIKTAVFSYIGISLTPLILRFFNSDTELALTMSYMLILYLVMIMIAATRSHNTIKQNIALQIENTERQLSLQQSELHYQTILETSPDDIFLLDESGTIQKIYRAGSEHKTKDLIGKKAFTLIPDSYQIAFAETLQQAVTSKQLQTIETTLKLSDGMHYFLNRLNPVNFEGKEFIVLISTDITERIEAKLALQAKTAQLHTVISCAPLVLWANDKNGIFTLSEGRALEDMGLQAGQVIGQSIFSLYAEYPEVIEATKRAIKGQSFVCEIDVKDRYYESYFAPLFDEKNEIQGCIGVAVDITKRKQAEQLVEEKEATYHALFEMSDDANMTLDKEGFLDCNQATIEMFGYKNKAEFIGQHPSAISPPYQADGTDSRIAADQRIETAYQQGKNFFEWTHRRANGEDFPAEVLLTPMTLNGKDVLQAIVRDISSRKQTELGLLKATEEANRANQAKSEFLSNMSHELRTPLNAILGFGQLLAMDIEDDEQKRNVDEILKAGDHLLTLINEILDLSKIETGNLELSLEPCHLNTIIEEVIALIKPLAEIRNIHITNNISQKTNYSIQVDYTRFKQVMLNLLSNAVKYNRDKGTITISCEVGKNNKLRIKIGDTGEGLSEEQLKILFDPFVRMDRHKNVEGTGIGLTITRHLIELMAGTIGVESQQGKGSTFWVETNICQDTTEQPLKPGNKTLHLNHNSTKPSLKKTILYIEDNPANLRLVTNIIEKRSPYTILSAPNASLGLTLAEAQLPNLILMDINLPDINGYMALSQLRGNESTKDIPVIAISANATQEDIERGQSAGFHDYLTKPIDIKILLHSLNEVLT